MKVHRFQSFSLMWRTSPFVNCTIGSSSVVVFIVDRYILPSCTVVCHVYWFMWLP